MKKQYLIFLILLIPALVSCKNKKADAENSYTKNLTEEEIVKGNSYSQVSSRSYTNGNKTTIQISKFNGIERLVTFSPKNQTLEITLTNEVEKGDLRIVLCDEESIIYEFTPDAKEEVCNVQLSSNKYYLKIAGENAKFKLEMEYQLKKSELPVFEGTVL